MNHLSSTKKIILPGGAGLVGQNLIAHLKQSGYKHIVVLDKHEKNLAIVQHMHPDITAVKADLSAAGNWSHYFEKADIVVMLQAQIGAKTEEPFLQNNITSTKHVIDAIKTHQVPYTIHISSSVVESVASDFYTQTKKAQEKLVLESGIKCIVLRPTLMFGWFDRKHLGWLARFMKKTPLFPIPGSGKYMRQPLYVGDFCKIIMSCIEKPIVGQIYNISGLEKVDYIDMIRGIKTVTHAKTAIIKIPYFIFYILLKTWSLFDKNPPFTVEQLAALTAGDHFEVINWPEIFGVQPTSFLAALNETFNDPRYSKVELVF